MNASPRTRTVIGGSLLVMTALGAGLTACGAGGHPLPAEPFDAADQISVNTPDGDGRKADPDKPLEITTEDGGGRITDVTAVDAAGRRLAGELSADGTRWHSTSPLAADAHYTVRVSTEDEAGAPGRRVVAFDTGAPAGKQRLGVTFGPASGTYGVGQPVTAQLSRPVTGRAQRAAVERGLRVESVPAVTGAWYWVNDKELHYRPEDYWPAHATVRVRSDLAGVRVGDRLRGTASEPVTLTIGERVLAVTDASAHRMTVYKNDAEIQRFPVTTGKPGFETRNGVKVVLAKQRLVRMRGTSIGIAEDSPDSYDLQVHYATRVTWSGEYVHAAPWSVDSQGYENVSHGCVGMSTEDAEWFYDHIREGDVVKVLNSNGRTMEPFGNGFGDWNVPWKTWRKGSALNPAPPTAPNLTETARLRPTAL
jgi:lipoprotein-anchoring transpeptidase ErfK/SrfK